MNGSVGWQASPINVIRPFDHCGIGARTLNIGMPTGEIARQLRSAAFDGPGLHLPIVALDNAQEIQ
jgi:hypothetical protein